MCSGEDPRAVVLRCIIPEPLEHPLIEHREAPAPERAHPDSLSAMDPVAQVGAQSPASRSAGRGASSLLRAVVAEHAPIFVIMALHVGFGWVATASGMGRVLTMAPLRWSEFAYLLSLALYWLPVLFVIELW